MFIHGKWHQKICSSMNIEDSGILPRPLLELGVDDAFQGAILRIRRTIDLLMPFTMNKHDSMSFLNSGHFPWFPAVISDFVRRRCRPHPKAGVWRSQAPAEKFLAPRRAARMPFLLENEKYCINIDKSGEAIFRLETVEN